MIADSLALYAPGTPLERSDRALRTKLGFPAVAGLFYSSSPGIYFDALVLIVVEPQDSELARRSRLPADSLPDRVEWRGALAPFLKEATGEFNGGLLTNALIGYGAFRKGWPDSARQSVLGAVSPDAAERVWAALSADTADVHRTMAIWSLRHDRNDHNRIAAAAVLANFAASDSTWWALAEALRDPSDLVSEAASRSLETLAERFPRYVDWEPVAPLVRHLLDGANPWVLTTVLEALAQTDVSPLLAAPLLKGGGYVVLGCLGTNFEGLRGPAHRLLVRLSGQDFGEEPTFWAEWIERL